MHYRLQRQLTLQETITLITATRLHTSVTVIICFNNFSTFLTLST